MQVFTALYAGMSEQIKVERNKHHHPLGDRKEWDLWEMWFSSFKKNPSKQRAEIFVWLNSTERCNASIFDNITKLTNLIFFLKFR